MFPTYIYAYWIPYFVCILYLLTFFFYISKGPCMWHVTCVFNIRFSSNTAYVGNLHIIGCLWNCWHKSRLSSIQCSRLSASLKFGIFVYSLWGLCAWLEIHNTNGRQFYCPCFFTFFEIPILSLLVNLSSCCIAVSLWLVIGHIQSLTCVFMLDLKRQRCNWFRIIFLFIWSSDSSTTPNKDLSKLIIVLFQKWKKKG